MKKLNKIKQNDTKNNGSRCGNTAILQVYVRCFKVQICKQNLTKNYSRTRNTTKNPLKTIHKSLKKQTITKDHFTVKRVLNKDFKIIIV